MNRLAFACLLPLSALGASALADVHVIDASGAGDFLEVQPAVDAAFDGDTLLIRGGSYGAFAVGDKELSIVADVGAAVTTGAIEVANLAAGKTLFLGGLAAAGSVEPGIWIHDCAGAVRVEGCDVEGGSGVDNQVDDGWPGALIQSSRNVVWTACILRGGPDSGTADFEYFQAGDGLEAESSRVAVYDCTLLGSRGADALALDAGHGGHGASIAGGFFFASGSDVLGGDGGVSNFFCGFSGDAGDGLVLTQSAPAELVDNRVEEGMPALGPGCSFCETCGTGEYGEPFDVEAGSSANQIPGQARSFRSPVVTFEGQLQTLTFTGKPGEVVQLLAGDPVFHFLPGLHGVRAIRRPPFISLLPTGAVPASGTLEVTQPLRRLDTAIEAITVFQQALFNPNHLVFGSEGQRTLGSPSSLVVVNCSFSPDCNDNGMPDVCETLDGFAQDLNANGVPDECEPDCNTNGVPDDLDIAQGTSNDCDLNQVPDDCQPDCNMNGVADTCDIAGGVSLDGDGNGVPDECQDQLLIYVDETQMGPADGLSWATAYPDVQTALADADGHSPLLSNIWVAQGIYRPGSPGAGRDTTFVVPEGASLFGGFAGGETSLDQRDIANNVTTLSGDLLGNDGPGFTGYEENCFTVVSVFDPAVCLDGFTIRAGNANGPGFGNEPYNGGGLYIEYFSTSLTVRNCLFTENQAEFGAAVSIESSGAHLRDCRFVDNRALDRGGAVHSNSKTRTVTVSECTFSDNTASGKGGGLWIEWSDTRVLNSLFQGNTANRGGAIDLYSQLGAPAASVRNCTIVGNEGMQFSGGIIQEDGTLDVHNTVLWNNTEGGVITERGQLHSTAGTLSVIRSCIRNLNVYSGNNNIGDDPLFVDPDGADDVPGNLDDDYRLGSGSACVDSGRNQSLFVDEFDLDGDGNTTELWPFDLDGLPRRQDDPAAPNTGVGNAPLVDRGAYERPGS